MPRTNPIPQKEKEICGRLREFRKSTKLSQVAFARELGLDSGQLRNYEHARAPVRFELARHASSVFGMSLAWLATGKGDSITFDKFDPELEKKISPRMLFSEAFETHLKVIFDELDRLLEGAIKRGVKRSSYPPLGLPPERWESYVLGDAVRNIHQALLPSVGERMADEVWNVIRRFIAENRHASEGRNKH